jgi:hypothetical protein
MKTTKLIRPLLTPGDYNPAIDRRRVCSHD